MKQPKSFEEGMDRLQGLLAQLQDEATPLAAVTALCVIWEYLYYCLASPSINRTRNFVQELVL